jgi:hypothetical protein
MADDIFMGAVSPGFLCKGVTARSESRFRGL